MAFPRICYANMLNNPGPTVATASSTEAGFALADAYDYKPWKIWKSGTVVTGITIDFDMGSSSDYASVLGLVNHNITSEGGTIEVKADNSNPPTTVRIVAYTPTSGDVELKDFASHAASRYYRITLAKGGNFTNKPYIGEIFLGNPMTFPEYMNPDVDPFNTQVENSIVHSEGGQFLGAVTRGRRHREPIDLGAAAGIARSFHTSDIKFFIRDHYDKSRPFYFQLDSADSDFSTPYYLVKPNDGTHRRQAIGGMWNRMSVSMPAVEAFMEAP